MRSTLNGLRFETFRKAFLIMMFAVPLPLYQNCAKVPLLDTNDNDDTIYMASHTTSTSTTTPSNSSTRNLPAQNYLSEPAPSLICGEAGYSYLMRNYLVKSCGTCHDGSANLNTISFANPNNVTGSFIAAKFITKSEFLTTATDNRFCGTACSISRQSETFRALSEWLSNRDCP